MEPKAAALPTMPVAAAQDRPDAAKEARAQIDRIIYISSLASKFSDVDPMMDDLREVTAAWDGSSALSPAQKQKLDGLESRLKQYLITSDPLRTFTEASLSQQLAAREGKGKINPVARSIIAIILASIAASGLAYVPFIPISADSRPFLAIPLFFVALHIGISWLYLTALKNFNQEMRKAVKLIVVGVILFALAFSHYAAIGAFNLQRYEIFQFAGITWLVAAPFFFIYFGIRMYAQQLGIQSWALKLPIVAVAWAVLMALAALIPPVAPQNTFVAIFQNTGGICLPFFPLLAAVLVRKIRKVVTPVYARPMMWMYVYLVVNVITSAIANIPFSPDADGGIPLYTLMVVFGIPDQLLLMMTGYSFKKELSK